MDVEIRSDGKADVWVYNSGAGIESQHPSRVEGGKLKYQLMIKLEGLDRSAVEDPCILQALLEPCSAPLFRQDVAYEEHNGSSIYEQTLRRMLVKGGGTVAVLEGPLAGFMTAQRSGSCAWSSLLPSVRRELDMREYKRFKHQVKLETLVDFFRKMPENPTPLKRVLLAKAVEKFARHTAKLFARTNPLLSREEALQCYQLIRRISSTLKEFESAGPLPEVPLYLTPPPAEFDNLFTAVTVCAAASKPLPGNPRVWVQLDKTEIEINRQVQAHLPLSVPTLDWSFASRV